MSNMTRDWQDEFMGTDDFDWGEDASTFGDRLALAREYAGMDQMALARRLGVRLETVQNWETDRSEPRANRLQMLSGLLGVSIIWLLTGEGDGAPSQSDGGGTADATLSAVLAELRELRLAQTRLADRAGMLEKRLRALATAG